MDVPLGDLDPDTIIDLMEGGLPRRLHKRNREHPDYVRPPRRTKAEIGNTYNVTYDLLREGLSLADVATKRGLSLSTIEGHVARGITEGLIELDEHVPSEVRDRIAEAMREQPDKNLNELRAILGEAVSYGQLKMVQAWLKREE
jgi:uncharacterized protein YpbB